MSILLMLQLFCLMFASSSTNSAVVETPLGRLQGSMKASIHGRVYEAFEGIPYAKPPIGELRFKNTEPFGKWEGVLDASKTASPCVQIKSVNNLIYNKIETSGEEDCLYLNVYRPQEAKASSKLPVMVWIHGGAFMSGSPHLYGTGILMDEDIILVTVQYRLATMGFLSTEDDIAPGNQGLKDQAEALRWVQAAIESFGGDSKRVTIFGESAGGGAVHLQVLSPKTEGLFQRAIVQSGNALNHWAVASGHLDNAKILATSLNCPNTTSQEIIDCLREKDAHDVTKAAGDFSMFYLFPIVMAPRVDGDFLPELPEVLLKEQQHNKVDLIFGTVKDDGAIFSYGIYMNEGRRNALLFNFPIMGPASLDFNIDDVAVLNQTIAIYDKYVGGPDLNRETADDATQMFTDRSIRHGSVISASQHATAGQKVFQYEFVHRGQFSYGDQYNLDIGLEWVSHVDELQYLFEIPPLYKPLERDDDIKLRNIMVKMWTNFAKFGNPTPKDSDLNFVWSPMTSGDCEDFLIIQPEPHMGESEFPLPKLFWKSLPLRMNLVLYPEYVGVVRVQNEKSSADITDEDDDEAVVETVEAIIERHEL